MSWLSLQLHAANKDRTTCTIWHKLYGQMITDEVAACSQCTYAGLKALKTNSGLLFAYFGLARLIKLTAERSCYLLTCLSTRCLLTSNRISSPSTAIYKQGP